MKYLNMAKSDVGENIAQSHKFVKLINTKFNVYNTVLLMLYMKSNEASKNLMSSQLIN